MQDQRADVGVADGAAVGRRAHQGLVPIRAGADAVLDHHGLAGLLISWPTRRAVISALPPAAAGTISVIARSGYGPCRLGGQAKEQGGKAGCVFHDDSPGVLLVTSLWSAGVPKMFGVLILLFSFSNIDRA